MIPRLAVAAAITIALAALAACDPVKPPPPLTVPPQVVDLVRSDTTDEMMPESRDTLVADLRPDTLDLDGDGSAELMVRGIEHLCGAQNCRVWIFRRTTDGWVQLLHAYTVQTLEAQQTVTNGYRDIMTSAHSSATESVLELYKFDGRRYRLAECYDRKYEVMDEQGEIHELEQPQVTRVTCDDDE